MFAENFNTAEGYGLYGGFNSVFVCDDGISVAKQVDFPNGWTDDTNLSFKVLFKNGHNCADASTPMTLNGIAVVVNKYGTLIPLPIHEMDDSGTPIYKSLQPNTILEMYYTDNYDGVDTPAYVVIGNPIVLSSTDYTIYADGSIKYTKENVLSNWEDAISYLGTTRGNATPIPYDGFIVCERQMGGYGGWMLFNVYDGNSETTFQQGQRADHSDQKCFNVSIVLKKGDLIYGDNSQAPIRMVARWYKNRDYSNR